MKKTDPSNLVSYALGGDGQDGEMSDIVSHCGGCRVENLKLEVGAEVNESLGLPNVVGTGPWSKGMAGIFHTHPVNKN